MKVNNVGAATAIRAMRFARNCATVGRMISENEVLLEVGAAGVGNREKVVRTCSDSSIGFALKLNRQSASDLKRFTETPNRTAETGRCL